VTPANLFDLSIQFKPETEEVKPDELKHILDFLPDIYKELARQTDNENEE
jgi:hypothetical protein